MEKILITGANGLLGQKLVSLLANDSQYSVLATARGACRFNLPNNTSYQSLDITDADACAATISEFQPDAIFHAGAMTQVDACEDERELCDSINIDGVANLIQAIGDAQIHFVHISTDFIFDGIADEYDENSAAKPLSYYGLSKWKSEQLFQEVSFPYTILRTVLVYGVLEDLSRSNIILWAKGALEEKQQINVVDDQFRCPTLAEDLAWACLASYRKKATGIYNLSGKEFLSILELVKRVAQYWDLDASLIKSVKTADLNQKAQRPPKTNLCIDKAMRDLAYKPKSFNEGLALVDHQLKNLKPLQ